MRKNLLLFLFFCGVSLQVAAKQKTLTGTVTGAEDKQPVVGCTVQLKGTTYGITTDINGKYKLSVPQNATTLVFSYIGMKKKEAEIANRSVIDVSLESDVKGLDSNRAMDNNPADIESINVLKSQASAVLSYRWHKLLYPK